MSCIHPIEKRCYGDEWFDENGQECWEEWCGLCAERHLYPKEIDKIGN